MQQSLKSAVLWTAAIGSLFCLASTAAALEPKSEEETAIKACEQKLCTMVLGRPTSGPDLKCDIAKTWDRKSIKKGESSTLSWGFGDARCTVDLNLSRSDIVAALTEPKHVVKIPEHEVNCVVEQDGKPNPVLAKLAPKLQFKNGKVEKIWLNLSKVVGPTAVKATVNLAASLEDNLGLFHRGMLKSVNKFLHTQCDKRYHADGRPKPEAENKKKKKAEAAIEANTLAAGAP
jgi:hypothetical protein